MSDDRFYPPSRPRRVEGGIRARSTRGTIAQSWWSERFIDGLESIGVGGRLARGRTYARAGQVLDLTVDAGSAVALVQGSRPAPYRVRVGLPAFGKAEWGRVEQALADDAWYAAKLLAGEMPTDIEDVFAAAGLTLLPAGVRELSMDCSCPDAEVPCKHLAATLFLLAESFDADPFAILALRGRSRDELLDNLRARRGGAPPAADQHGPGAGAVPLADRLDTFFLAAPQPAGPARGDPRRRPARPAARRRRHGPRPRPGRAAAARLPDAGPAAVAVTEAAMARPSSPPRRHRMRREARRSSARGWIASGAPVTVKAYARRYGVDRYTAHDDLVTIGFPIALREAHWAVRPPATPKRRPAEPTIGDEDENWVYVGGQRMFVMGYTSGGAPFGLVESDVEGIDGAADSFW